MKNVKNYSGTEPHSSLTNLFLYRRLKKSRVYKTLLLSSILHSLLFTYHKLVRTRELLLRKGSTRVLGNSFSISKGIYLARLIALSSKQNTFVLDVIANQLKMHHFLNPYIPVEQWDAFLLFLTNPGSLESWLMKLNSGRLTTSSLSLNKLLSISSRKRVTNPLRSNWSYENLSLFFNFKFNFFTTPSTRKHTNQLLGFGSNYDYNSIICAMYKKLDVFLESTDLLLQDIHLVETFVNGCRINPATFFLAVGDVLSYKASSRNSDVSVASNLHFVNRKWLVSLQILFTLNRIYTGVIWSKFRSFFLKLTHLGSTKQRYFFYSQMVLKFFSENSIFPKASFSLGTTTCLSPTSNVINTKDINLRGICIFSNRILQSCFFTVRTDSVFETIGSVTFLDLHFLIIYLLHCVVSIFSITLLESIELVNIIIFLNRWFGLNKLSDSRARVIVSLDTIFYNQRIHTSMNTYRLSKLNLPSDRTVFNSAISRNPSFVQNTFLWGYYSKKNDFFVGVDNLRSLHWSFFLNLKYNTLTAFNFLRWRHLTVEYLLFYSFNHVSIFPNLWFHNHDKVGSGWKYSSFLKYS